ncbi:MAG: pirin family protein [Nocardioidaceae bacterium]|nr:pirin family protein [Nocardioidaceae bacterium]
MSNFESTLEIDCTGRGGADAPVLELLEPRSVLLGPRQEVRRVLPHKLRRMIGAWCFVDHYGPATIGGQPGMRVAPHPHTGLQTVSWLLEEEVHHRDSLGSDTMVVPGELNLMTAGAGIAHSEDSPPDHSATLHGLQLWVALPESIRHSASRDFTQYQDLPSIQRDGLRATVLIGELEGATSAATAYTPIVGAELAVEGDVVLTLRPDFEHGVLLIDGSASVEGQELAASEIAFVGSDRDRLHLSTQGPARLLLLGGEPFDEPIVMWWNFIGRTHEEIVEYREQWNAGRDRFGAAPGTRPTDGVAAAGPERLLAPPMPAMRLKSRGRQR